MSDITYKLRLAIELENGKMTQCTGPAQPDTVNIDKYLDSEHRVGLCSGISCIIIGEYKCPLSSGRGHCAASMPHSRPHSKVLKSEVLMFRGGVLIDILDTTNRHRKQSKQGECIYD